MKRRARGEPSRQILIRIDPATADTVFTAAKTCDQSVSRWVEDAIISKLESEDKPCRRRDRSGKPR